MTAEFNHKKIAAFKVADKDKLEIIQIRQRFNDLMEEQDIDQAYELLKVNSRFLPYEEYKTKAQNLNLVISEEIVGLDADRQDLSSKIELYHEAMTSGRYGNEQLIRENMNRALQKKQRSYARRKQLYEYQENLAMDFLKPEIYAGLICDGEARPVSAFYQLYEVFDKKLSVEQKYLIMLEKKLDYLSQTIDGAKSVIEADNSFDPLKKKKIIAALGKQKILMEAEFQERRLDYGITNKDLQALGREYTLNIIQSALPEKRLGVAVNYLERAKEREVFSDEEYQELKTTIIEAVQTVQRESLSDKSLDEKQKIEDLDKLGEFEAQLTFDFEEPEVSTKVINDLARNNPQEIYLMYKYFEIQLLNHKMDFFAWDEKQRQLLSEIDKVFKILRVVPSDNKAEKEKLLADLKEIGARIFREVKIIGRDFDSGKFDEETIKERQRRELKREQIEIHLSLLFENLKRALNAKNEGNIQHYLSFGDFAVENFNRLIENFRNFGFDIRKMVFLQYPLSAVAELSEALNKTGFSGLYAKKNSPVRKPGEPTIAEALQRFYR